MTCMIADGGFANMTTPTLENLPACPVETTLLLIGNKWQVLILRELAQRHDAL